MNAAPHVPGAAAQTDPGRSSEPPAKLAPRRIRWLPFWVALYAAALHLPFLASYRILTHHEGMVTQPALRILENGSWLVPYYTHDRWLDKPPLMNWITAACFAVSGGFNPFAARLPAAASAIGLAVLIAAIARRYTDDRTALLAGLTQAASVYALIYGRLGEIDMPLTLLIAGAHAALLWTWVPRPDAAKPPAAAGSTRHPAGEFRLPLSAAITFYTLMALAVLAKGLLAVVLVAMTVLVFCLVRRTLRPLWGVLLTPGVACFVVLVGAWFAGAYWVAGDELAREWSKNNLQRFMGDTNLTLQPFWTYLENLPWLALPATIWLVVGARFLYRETRRPGALFEQFLWCWFIGGLIFLHLSAFKHKHYAMPVLPPLSILAARVMVEHIRRVPVHAPRFYAIVFTSIALAFAVVNATVMPQRDPRKEMLAFVQQHVTALPAQDKLFIIGLGQHAAYPYIQHPCVYLPDNLAAAKHAVEELNAPAWVLTLRQYLDVASREGLHFTEVAAEPPHRKLKPHEALVLLRVVPERQAGT